MRDRRSCASLVLLAFVCGCAAPEVDPRAEAELARELVREATGQAEVYDPDAPALTPAEIEAALADGLGLDESLRLALLNNRRLQAGFAGLGVARADFVQAGLLQNPSLGIGLLMPSGGGSPKISLDLFQDIVGLWEIPRRQALAQAELQARVLELSRFAAGLVADTKDAYYESVASGERLATARESAAVALASLDGIERRVEGGVARRTAAGLAKSQALVAELARLDAQREHAGARRRLAALLSLEVELLEVGLSDGLPEPTLVAIDREALVESCRSTRLDLRAAQAAVAAAEAELELESGRTFPRVEVGVGLERPEGGSSTSLLAGPEAAIELPLFDRNDVRTLRARYRRDQLELEYQALAADIGQQVRAAVDRALAAARSAQFVGSELLPEAERAAELARTEFALGGTTLLPLLESQRAALEARRLRVESRLEAAKSAVDVERTAGATLEALARAGGG